MSLAILKKKAMVRDQTGNPRASPPGSNNMNRGSTSIFNKVSHNKSFSLNGNRRSNHYIGSGSHRPTPTRSCEAQSNTPKLSVLTSRGARNRTINTRANINMAQPDSNFPENDSQGIYIFNKKLKHDCVNHSTTTTTKCGQHGNQDVIQHFPDCQNISGQKCSTFIGSRVNPRTLIHKDYGVAQSYDEYLSKRLLPQCTNIVNSSKKVNNIGITNARCGSHH